MHPRARIPISTYRLQFGSAFGFAQARRIVSYLDDLGISDCYASPLLKALPGSSHGYDVCDHNTLNPLMGSEAEFEALVEELRGRSMGLLFDFVPNHMGIGTANAAWMDVLENGPGSPYGDFFDIDWHPLLAEEWLENKVLLPVLADPYGKVLENKELRLFYRDGTFHVKYGDLTLPVAPRTQTCLLARPLQNLQHALAKQDQKLQEFESIITALNHLPPYTETSPEQVAERQREKEVVRRRLSVLCSSSPTIRQAIEQTVRAYNGVKGEPRSFDLLDELLEQQAYRLAYWRVAADEINYRRFFDINDLAAIKVELPAVFDETHRLILRLLAEGKVTGLRIDHPDGLWDPAGYFRQLQMSYLTRLLGPRAPDNGRETAKTSQSALTFQGVEANGLPLYVVAEKILMPGEQLPDDWLVFGTTGYDFANHVNGIFVDKSNEKTFDSIYAGFTGTQISFSNLVNASKKMIMLIALASEVNLLGYQLKRIAVKNRWHRDFTLNGLTFALREVIATLRVYRTYLTPLRPPGKQDREHIERAVADAKRRNPRTSETIFDFIGDLLLGQTAGGNDNGEEQTRFVMEFQQTTGPVMAKGLEDTAYYSYNRLSSLNEVGGSPERFGISVPAFHRLYAERQRAWPHSLNATSTHDTKRSEDVRARINVLSEMPKEWRAAINRWCRTNDKMKVVVDGRLVPDPNEEYLFYQTLIGAWPFVEPAGEQRAEFVRRMQAYMSKAAKEAKVNTSWINPNTSYETAIQKFVSDVLFEGEENGFLSDFRQLQTRVARYGVYNSLAQTLLKITVPGVPDIYQGNELWDLSLVDPDNRRPVDFELRRRLLKKLLQAIEEAGGNLVPLAGELAADYQDGRVKLFVTHHALAYRRHHRELFELGSYQPLQLKGTKRNQACAFARRRGNQFALVVAPRLVVGLTAGLDVAPLGDQVWGDTELLVAPGHRRFRNVFTGEAVEAARKNGQHALAMKRVMSSFPVALLEPI